MTCRLIVEPRAVTPTGERGFNVCRLLSREFLRRATRSNRISDVVPVACHIARFSDGHIRHPDTRVAFRVVGIGDAQGVAELIDAIGHEARGGCRKLLDHAEGAVERQAAGRTSPTSARSRGTSLPRASGYSAGSPPPSACQPPRSWRRWRRWKPNGTGAAPASRRSLHPTRPAPASAGAAAPSGRAGSAAAPHRQPYRFESLARHFGRWRSRPRARGSRPSTGGSDMDQSAVDLPQSCDFYARLLIVLGARYPLATCAQRE